LNAEAAEGHLSAICFHGANVSHRLGSQADPEEIRATIAEDRLAADAFERCSEHLKQNGVDLQETMATLGPALQFDVEREEFVGKLAREANALSRRNYREPFVVPDLS
jgi:hypothetical protein